MARLRANATATALDATSRARRISFDRMATLLPLRQIGRHGDSAAVVGPLHVRTVVHVRQTVRTHRQKAHGQNAQAGVGAVLAPVRLLSSGDLQVTFSIARPHQWLVSPVAVTRYVPAVVLLGALHSAGSEPPRPNEAAA